MANTPDLRSKEQITGELIDGLLARIRKDIDLNDGSTLTRFLEAIGQSNFKSEANIISILDSLSVDRATGEALQRLAKDAKVPIFQKSPATGRVDLTDTSFQKISSRIYSGQPAPVAGSLTIYVADASKFAATNGKIYIGRGNGNVEGPLDYTTVQPEAGGAYWSITLNGVSPTTKFHNIGESVILAQGGNRTVAKNTGISTAEGANIKAVSFVTTAIVTIPDGEVTAFDVPIRCSVAGIAGNVPRGALKQVSGANFPAVCFNNFAFFNGREDDTEDEIKARIKAYEQAKAKGIAKAIKQASLGIIAKDELKKVQSANTVSYTDNTSALIFDDGTGYEGNFVGASFETIVDKAIGGERESQLRKKPIAQARIANVSLSPYNIEDLAFLAVEVDGVESLHQFKAADFKVPSSATPFEISASINGNSNLNFLATTFNNGKNLVIYPRKSESNNIRIKTVITGTDANSALGFPKNETNTIRLYKNDLPLYQDGAKATVPTRAKALWSSAIVPNDTLKYKVDKTPEVTVTFTTADFQAVDQNSIVSFLTSIDIWAKVMNSKMPGVIATVVGDIIQLSSARGATTDAALEITGGTLFSQIFDTTSDLSKEGRTADFTLNKQTGQIEYAIPLVADDKITAGSQYAKGSMLSISLASGIGSAGNLYFVADGATEFVPNSLKPNTLISFSKTGTKLSITGSNGFVPEGFDTVQAGDWVIVWSNPTDNVNLQNNVGFWRVESSEVGELIVDDGQTARTPVASPFVASTDRIVILRTDAPVQKFSFAASNLADFVAAANLGLEGIQAEILGAKVRFSTRTLSDDGELYLAVADQGGLALGLPLQKARQNTPSHYGFVAQLDSEINMPSFTHGEFGPYNTDSSFEESSYLDNGGNEDDFAEILQKIGAPLEGKIIESNLKRRAFISEFNPNNNRVALVVPDYMKVGQSTIQEDDRYFLRSAYKFDSRDTVTAIVDSDTQTKVFTVSPARSLLVSSNSTPTNQDFSASDNQSSLALKDPSSFFDFDFKDFKVHRQAQALLTDGVYGLRIKSTDFGQVNARVGIYYPTSTSQTALSHTFDTSEVLDYKINLPAVDVRVPNWDFSSSFTVSKTTTGGKDVITYTWRAGTQPDFSSSGADVKVDDVVFISSSSDFLVTNEAIIAKIVSVTATSFTFEMPTGAVVNDAVTFTSFLNQNGVITVTTNIPHQLSTGQRVGFYNTTFPVNGSFLVSIISPTSFSVNTGMTFAGGVIQSGTHVNNVVTLNINAHGLTAGNVILVSGVGAGSYDGLATVSSAPTANQILLIRSGSSAAIGMVGRVDIQSYGAGTISNITTVTKSGYTVTADTSAAHGLSVGSVVKIDSLDIDDWSNLTTYGVNDIVEETGIIYISLVASNLGLNPSSNPASWAVTSLDLTGTFLVNTTPTATQFTYLYQVNGNAGATGGTATTYSAQGSMARALAGATNENLAFASASTTVQEVVDYLAANIPDRLIGEAVGSSSAPITMSTQENDAAANYISGTVSNFYFRKGQRKARIATSSLITKGSTVTISGTAYDGMYVVQTSYFDAVLAENIIEVQMIDLAATTQTVADAGTLTGYTPALMLVDGENSIKQNDLSALIGSPMFQVKKPWVNAPAIGEELRLVAVTGDHLYRFFNKLVVTGLSNVSKIELSHYSRELQISTNTFGNSGSIQIAGGSANRVNAAIVGSGREISDKLGAFNIPYELKKGLVEKQWIQLANTVRQNKDLGFNDNTQVRLFSNRIQLNGSLNGNFQTIRSTTQISTTEIKMERHGDFLAFIKSNGTSLGLDTAGVQEGDWVRVRNASANPWITGTTYVVGNRVSYAGTLWTSLQVGNVGNQPDTSPLFWRNEEIDKANQGIFQVVRIFGEDSFWVYNPNGVEQVTNLGDTSALVFYSYDSVMPNDTLVLNTNVLGSQNIGRYKVLDSNGTSTNFPTATELYVETISNPTVGFVTLGGEFVKVNIEEENPLVLWKRIYAVGSGQSSFATVMTDSPNLMNRVTTSLGASITAYGKMSLNEDINFGVDAYRYYVGLIAELNKVIYGDSTDPINYPGVRASGTYIDIKPAIIKRIKASLAVRVKTGVPFTELRERIKSAVAGYVNLLEVGQSVSISSMIAAAGSIPGVVSVAVTFPQYDSSNDLIPVGADEKAYIVDPTIDVTISVI